MAAGVTYDPIATETLSSGTGTVSFTGITASYTDLVLVMNAATGVNDADWYIQVNSDTGSNYSWIRMAGTTVVGGSSAASSTLGFRVGNMSGSNVGQNNCTVNFMNYSNTSVWKSVIARGVNAALLVELTSGLYASTSAISSIQIKTQSGNFSVGSTFTLYGIAAA